MGKVYRLSDPSLDKNHEDFEAEFAHEMAKLEVALKRPFPLNRIHWVNKGKGGLLAHLTARDVMVRLDDVCGVAGWKSEIIYHPNGVAVCNLSILICGMWVTKSDASGETNFEAEKGASSTAFKRSASAWGIGRYLYVLPQGASPDNIHTITWATPEGYDAIMEAKFDA